MEKIISEIAEMTEITYPVKAISTTEQLRKNLADIISYLIDHDFEKLLWILYRIDVDEEKVKKLLSEHLPEDAPVILADLIIIRQQKKEELKKEFSQHQDDPIDDDLRM